MQKILIIQTSFIGDVVLATSILEKLHQFFPGAKIDFLLRKGNEGLLADHPFLNEIIIWDKKKNKWSNLFKLLKFIRKKKYDKVINLQRFASTGLLTAFSKAKEKIGFNKNPLSFLFTTTIKHSLKNNRHEIERNNDLIKHFTDDVAAKPKLYPTEQDFKFAELYSTRNYICISPASVWFTKQYPAQKWIELINMISDSYQIYLLGAANDIELCESIKISLHKNNVEVLAGKLTFLQSAALIKNAKMNYVNDSAPLHFASAMNAPVTAIFCSTVPDFGFGPLSDTKFIVQTKEYLSCKPCTSHGRKACPLGHFKCALTIQKEQLLQTLSI